MTATEPARGPHSFFTFGMKAPLAVFTSIFLLVAIWYTAPSTISTDRYSPEQLEAFLSSPVYLASQRQLHPPPSINSTNTVVNSTTSRGEAPSEVPPTSIIDSIDSQPSQGPMGPSSTEEGEKISPAAAVQPPLISDTKLASSSPAVAPEPEQQQEERYIFPMLSSYVGTGNQLMEYKSAAVVARTLNRTLCMTPFFGGPARHFGYLGSNHYGLQMEERYDLEDLAKFVKFVPVSECMQSCNRTLHRVWKLRSSRAARWDDWFPNMPVGSINFDRNYVKWAAPEDILNSLGHLNEEPLARCVGLGGLFPGLRWRGGLWAPSAFMQHSKPIIAAANIYQRRLGTAPFISVHWRFEESNCVGHQLGLCFSRCGDGAVIGTNLKSPRFRDLPTTVENLHAKSFQGVALKKEDLAAAIHDKALEHGVKSVYLSTDGWLRGNVSIENVRWVVEYLRERGIEVAGLWQLGGLPNFADGGYVYSKMMAELFGRTPGEVVSNHMIALVEQEICGRSKVFLGSGMSSWSLAVFEARQSRRRRMIFEEELKRNNSDPGRTQQDLDRAVIDLLYADKHTAGPACGGSRDSVPETTEDETPDGWLDFEACEKRIDLGGSCVRLVSGIIQ